MDSVLKVVYDNWTDDKFPLPNGRHPVVNRLIQQELCSSPNTVWYSAQTRIQSQFNDNILIYDHSNFWKYFIDAYSISNAINIEQLQENDIAIWPIEIRTTLDSIYKEHCITVDGEVIKYNIIDTINPELLLQLKAGRVKILISYAHDPINHWHDLKPVEDFFESHGIDSSNIVVVPGNDYSAEYKQSCPAGKIKIIAAELMITQQVALNASSYPRKTSLGYLSDLVREADLDGEVRSKKFICFNRTMRPHRYALAYIALKLNLLDNNIMSFLNKGNDDILAIQKELKKFNLKNDTATYAERIYNLIPYEIDTQHLSSVAKNGFSIENSKKIWYTDTYVHIISETTFLEAKSLFISEKTWRPVTNLQPFIMVSSPGMLKKLRGLGFKTFHPFIDESYDLESNDSIRLQMIHDEIEKLNNMSLQEIHDWYYSIKDVLLHNQQHLTSFANINPFNEIFNLLINYYGKE
jgi:hypothetical protein